MNEDNTKHTPGPWEVNYREDVPTIAIWSCRYGTISPICRIWYAPEGAPPKREIRETDKANAHLIAAAPELLEACKAALPMCKAHGANGFIAEMLDIAIEKAEGRS